MSSRWMAVDQMIHELGSLRALVEKADAAASAESKELLELRTAVARAADTLHLVIAGQEDMLAKARRTLAEAREVGERAVKALERSRATQSASRTIREDARTTRTARTVARRKPGTDPDGADPQS